MRGRSNRSGLGRAYKICTASARACRFIVAPTLRSMQSATITVACPECGHPATVSMNALGQYRYEFDFVCQNGHHVPPSQTKELWTAAHTEPAAGQSP
jgi:hypothetical protein